MSFTEANTVESLIVDLLCGPQQRPASTLGDISPPYVTTGRSRRGNGWHYIDPSFLPRQPQDVFVESYVRAALIRLNPAIAALTRSSPATRSGCATLRTAASAAASAFSSFGSSHTLTCGCRTASSASARARSSPQASASATASSPASRPFAVGSLSARAMRT